MGTQSVFDLMPTPAVTMHTDDQGVILLESEMPLLAYSRRVGDWLVKWAEKRPDHVFIAERAVTSCHQSIAWRALTYSEFYQQVQQLAQGMIDAGLDGSRPLLVMSGNSVDHALVKMAAMHIGVPVTSLSVAYSSFSGKYDRLIAAVERLNPAMIFAEQGEVFAQPLAALPGDFKVLVSSGEAELSNLSQSVYALESMLDSQVSTEVQLRFDSTGPETHAKYMLTSGSTGQPKIVVVTQRMMCSNQQMIAQCLPFVESTPPVVLDWLPWSHTFGTNHNFNLVLRNGGTFYVDEGRPMPGLIEKTAVNIKAVQPTLFFNVPKGYEVLLPMLKEDKALAEAFFANLQMVFYAGAALSEPVWNELKVLAKAHNTDVFMTTEWGATETAPANTCVHWRLEKPGNIGVPMPGVCLKLVPNGGKMEIRVKGPNVFSQYLNDPKNTAEAFDKDSFYLIGDAGKLANLGGASSGILFDGRVSEDFKLSSGTWVCVATMRKRVVEALDGLVSDVLITGHNEDYISLVVFPSPTIYKLASDSSSSLTGSELMSNQVLHATFETALSVINAQAKGSSQRVLKVLMADMPPSIDLGEVTDKGNFNQRRLLETRKELVDLIYNGTESNAVIHA